MLKILTKTIKITIHTGGGNVGRLILPMPLADFSNRNKVEPLKENRKSRRASARAQRS